MSVPPNQFARLDGRLDRSVLVGKCVVIVGVGAVGSQVAKELANHAVGRLRMVDPDHFTIENRVRHALPVKYAEDSKPWNKAEGMADYLSTEVRGLALEAVSRKVDKSMSDDELDRWLADADLIVAATDEREAQRRIGRRALALDIPAIFPGLYEGHGGEVLVQRSPRHPCFFCWDGQRPADQTVRGAAAGNADILDVISLTTKLSLGILDRTADYFDRFLAPEPGELPPQLFVTNDQTLARTAVPRRPGCSSCAVGPSPLRQEAREAWRAAEQARTVQHQAPVRYGAPLAQATPGAPPVSFGEMLAGLVMAVVSWFLWCVAAYLAVLLVCAVAGLGSPEKSYAGHVILIGLYVLPLPVMAVLAIARTFDRR